MFRTFQLWEESRRSPGCMRETLATLSAGSLAFAKVIEAHYRQLGGEIEYDAQVDKILIEGGRAAGVSLKYWH